MKVKCFLWRLPLRQNYFFFFYWIAEATSLAPLRRCPFVIYALLWFWLSASRPDQTSGCERLMALDGCFIIAQYIHEVYSKWRSLSSAGGGMGGGPHRERGREREKKGEWVGCLEPSLDLFPPDGCNFEIQKQNKRISCAEQEKELLGVSECV